MVTKKQNQATPEALRRHSKEITDLCEEASQLCLIIPIQALLAEPEAKQELLARINRFVRTGRRLANRKALLFLFERSYAATHDEVELLDGEFTSFHDRVLANVNGFGTALLAHEQAKLSMPDFFNFDIPAVLTELDIETASEIARSYREKFVRNWHDELCAEVIAAANLLAESQLPIPAEFRTKAMSKQQAAGYLDHPNPDSGVRWLNRCIDDGTIRCEQLSRQSFVFDIRQFPKTVHRLILPS